MKACIVNYTPFRERLNDTVSALGSLNVVNNIEIVSLFDREDLNANALDAEHQQRLWLESIHLIAPTLLGNALFAGEKFPSPLSISSQEIVKHNWLMPRPLRAGELSVLYKHFYSIALIAISSSDYGLVVEDDIRIKPDSLRFFSECCNAMQHGLFDFIDLAGGCQLKPTMQEISRSSCRRIVTLDTPRTRCAAAYLLSKDLAKSLANLFFPLIFPIDWHMQYIFTQLSSYVFGWCNPEALIHGSENNLVQSWRS